jgi:glycosyltransferase involved in cell wall biosynthesis
VRVLYFHQHFSTPAGATGLRSYAMARRLVERGHQVTIVCGSYGAAVSGLNGPFVRGRRQGVVDGFEVIEIDLPYSNSDSYLTRSRAFVGFALRGIQLALAKNYDLVFATTTPLTAGVPAILARLIRGKRFVFEVRDLWPELPRAMGIITNPIALAMMSVLEWLSYHAAHRLIALAPGIVDGIARRGVPRDRITMIPNGCSLDLFRMRLPGWRPQQVRASDLMAVFAGTHGRANGLDALLEVASVLKRREADVIKIVLVGDGALKGKLMQRACAERLDNVVFQDPVDKERLARLLASADLGLQILANIPQFYYGTSPNKFFDYLAAGLPVATNYPGWLADLIREHRIGFVVPAQDPDRFADALQCAAADRDALIAMRKRARALAETQFDNRQLADRFVDWLEQCRS